MYNLGLIFFLGVAYVLFALLSETKFQFLRLGNRKYSQPLVRKGLLRNDAEYFGLESYLKNGGHTVEDFVANGVPLQELERIDFLISLNVERTMRILDEIREAESVNRFLADLREQSSAEASARHDHAESPWLEEIREPESVNRSETLLADLREQLNLAETEYFELTDRQWGAIENPRNTDGNSL